MIYSELYEPIIKTANSLLQERGKHAEKYVLLQHEIAEMFGDYGAIEYYNKLMVEILGICHLIKTSKSCNNNNQIIDVELMN